MWYETASNATPLIAETLAWYELRKKIQTPPRSGSAIAELKGWLKLHGVSEQDACLLSTWVGTGRSERAPADPGAHATFGTLQAKGSTTKGSAGFFEPGTNNAEDDCGTESNFFGFGGRTVWDAWQDAARTLAPVVVYDLARWGSGKSASALASVKANANQDAIAIGKAAVATVAAAATAAGGVYAASQLIPVVVAIIAAKVI